MSLAEKRRIAPPQTGPNDHPQKGGKGNSAASQLAARP
jgi:hypothetical protein